MLTKVSISTMFVSIALLVATAPAGNMAVTSLSINTDGTGAISINGTPLVVDTDFTFTLVNANAGITGGLTTYSQIGLFQLSSSYLTGYSGISIDASPTLGGAKPLGLAVPGDIVINALWQQNGGGGTMGTDTTGGGGGVCGGYRGGDAHPYYGLPGQGPGGGAGTGTNKAAGGSLVAVGSPGLATTNAATFPVDFHQYGGAITIDSDGPVRDLCGGSGGGGANDGNRNATSGSGGGGAVGFFCTVDSGSITVTAAGSIKATGANGSSNYHYGGAGSGGTIILAGGASGTVTNNGSLEAKGGAPSSLNGGGGGEIAIYYGGDSVLGSGSYSVAGGSGAGTGHYYTEPLLSGPVTGDLTINKFFDVDQDGVYEPADADKMLSGWSFEVRDPNGDLVATDPTDAGGQIVLTDLPAGDYTITETVKKDHDVTGTLGNPRVVTVAAGENATWFGNWLVADVNQDGIVDSQDFSSLKANFGKDPSLWTDGNINDDTIVDSQDFSLLKANFGKGVAPGSPGGSSPAPEPATMVLLGIGAAALIRRNRKASA